MDMLSAYYRSPLKFFIDQQNEDYRCPLNFIWGQRERNRGFKLGAFGSHISRLKIPQDIVCYMYQALQDIRHLTCYSNGTNPCLCLTQHVFPKQQINKS